MSDLDRWAQGEGPEPPNLRALLDAARAVPPASPEEEAHLEQVFRAKAAEQDRKRAATKRRTGRALWTGGLALGGATLAAAAASMMLARAPEERDGRRAGAPQMDPSAMSSADASADPAPSSAPPRRAPRLPRAP